MMCEDENVLSAIRAEVDRRIAEREAKVHLEECTLYETKRPIGYRFPEHVPPVTPRPPDLHAANLSFAARLVIAVRDRFDGDAPRVYRAARMTRAAYSKIVCDETQKVGKRTAIRFAFALRLNPDEARLLLMSAGFAFSHSQTEDFILEACLESNPPVYDWDVVNGLLREYGVDYQY